MHVRYKTLFFIISACLFLAPVSSAVQPPIPQMPSQYVVDLAGIIDDNVELRLNGYLQELEQKTTAQVVVLTITSLEGESIDDLTLTTAHDRWKLGQKGKDNGVLIVVSLEDKKYRFEIGYGLEGILPDSLVGSIGREYLVPYFQKGDYSTGLYAATLALINEIAVSEDLEITGMPKIRRRAYSGRSPKRSFSTKDKIFAILFVIGLIYLFIKHPRLFMLFLMFSMMGGGRRGGWGGGGGFGGGGGGFGGGGASGGW